MSLNRDFLTDGDGDFSDWFELYNGSGEAMNLGGYAVSDDPGESRKWVFPDISVAAGGYLLLFASGKDRRDHVGHWETVIERGDRWSYRPGTSEPPASWHTPAFDDGGWREGPSGFGYGDRDDATVVPDILSIYLRRAFRVEDSEGVLRSVLHLDYDDAFVAYLNGREVARSNIGEPGVRPSFDQVADAYGEAVLYRHGEPQAYEIPIDYLVPGENLLAIQVHNISLSSSDLSAIPFLTLGLSSPPPDARGTPEAIDLQLIHLHANFRLSAGGEALTLSDREGDPVDSIEFPSLPAGASFGRERDGGGSWVFFDEPSPGLSNGAGRGYTGIAGEPVLSHESGHYSSPIHLTIAVAAGDSPIYYTLDGSEPDGAAERYTEPIRLTRPTVVRSRAIPDDAIAGPEAIDTYLIGRSFELPLLSVTTDPDNLWDPETGFYVMGRGASREFPHFGANFWQDWEMPVHLEFFEEDRDGGFEVDCGAKIFGGWSRAFPQKSFSFFLRSKYGFGELRYQLFPDRPIDRFESFVIRNSGQDWGGSYFRDGLTTGLAAEMGVDVQAFRPVVVFVNGEYWGIYNMREKVSRFFLASNHDVEPDEVDLLEREGLAIDGDGVHYSRLLDFVEHNDLTIAANYEQVRSLMDIDEYISYQVAEIYVNNRDWPGNNVKFWRPRVEGGRWRWILFDTDFGFGIWDPEAYAFDTLGFALEDSGPSWPNPPWSTLLLRRLLTNGDFRDALINRFCDAMNSSFEPGHVAERIEAMVGRIDGELDAHLARWEQRRGGWRYHVDVMEKFAARRPEFMRSFLDEAFGVGAPRWLTLTAAGGGHGFIRVNALEIDRYPWRGSYFADPPVDVTAVPRPGYRFVRWEGLHDGEEAGIRLQLAASGRLTAVFESEAESRPVVINEINYNSASDFDPGDWIELFNPGIDRDLTGWEFRDSDDTHVFAFPPGSRIGADDYLILAADVAAFRAHFPGVEDVLGDFDFGLSGRGEAIRIFDRAGAIVDSLTYGNREPWPTTPDGGGGTLVLLDPGLDNALAGSWVGAADHGTPGRPNDPHATAVRALETTVPSRVALGRNYPNPFNSVTRIPYALPLAGRVEVTVFDMLGREVVRLADEVKGAGYWESVWDGTDSAGRRVGSGIYFYRLKAGGSRLEGRMLLLQ